MKKRVNVGKSNVMKSSRYGNMGRMHARLTCELAIRESGTS